jgi:ABC-type transporter Mla maintaining outer membrane lipid asymmetry ATPase subunit MlaF
LAEHVADRMIMLYQSRVVFFGTGAEWKASSEPEVERFRDLEALPGAGALSSPA